MSMIAFQEIKLQILLILVIGIFILPQKNLGASRLPEQEVLINSKEFLEKKKWQQHRVLKSLSKINEKIQQVLKEKTDLSNRGFVLRTNVGNLVAEIGDLEKRKNQKKDQVSLDLKQMRQMQAGAYQHILLNSYSSAQLNRNLHYLNAILIRNYQRFRDYDELVNELNHKRAHLVKESGRLKKLTQAFDKRENILRNEIVVKNRILNGIKRSQLFVEQRIEDLKKRTQSMGITDEGVLDSITRPNFAIQQGKLPPPAIGRVARHFGPYHSGEKQITLNSKGIFLETHSGATVKAVFSGVVSYVGAVPGLDQILVLDHGDHYFTVYGQLEDVKVRPGDEVAQSQIIARSGLEKFKKLNGIYFEIRHFSEPYNPTEWVRGLTL